MKTPLLLAALISTAAQAAPLKTQVFTAGPEGFLVNSTLISAEHDAVLVDAQFTLAKTHRLPAQLLESKKNLKTVLIPHAPPDHFFGVEVIQAASPQVEVVATPAVLKELT